MKNELLPPLSLAHRQGEWADLLRRQVRLYTMGDSTSLPAELAQQLLRSMEFTMQTYLLAGGAAADALPLEELLREGGKEIWRLTQEAKALHRLACHTDPGFGSVACRDTLDAIGGFFPAYDMRFFAQEIPGMIDYPLCQPVEDSLEGVLFIRAYLNRLILENRFCRCFRREEAVGALCRFHPAYGELVVNLLEPLLFCALGLVLLGKDPRTLRLSAKDCHSLYRRFHPWEAEAGQALEKAAGQLCNHLKLWDTALRHYLAAGAERLLPLLRVSSQAGYRNLFCAEAP